MPYRLRAFSGYITSTETWAFPEFSSLRFYRNSDRQEKTLTLNPNECQMAITKIENASSRLPEATKAYLDYLITCTPSERRKLHDDFWTELEGNGSLDIFSNTNNFRQYGEEFVKRKAENRLPHSENQFSPILQAKRKENIEIVLGEIYSILSNQYLSPDDKLMQITKIAQNSNHLLESTQTMEKEL
jgi:hypothetical protein